MKKYYRIYNRSSAPKKFSHNIFSIIGTKEPDLTKSISFLLYYSDNFRTTFLKLIDSKLKNLNLHNSDKIEYIKVFAEQKPDKSNDMIRRDITIQIKFKNGNKVLIIIEAKSPHIKYKNLEDIENQLLRYIDSDLYSDVSKFESLICVSLTNIRDVNKVTRKYTLLSITWEEIFLILSKIKSNDNYLVEMLYDHILSGGVMKFIEKEIFSPPAAKTYKKINELKIYCCQFNRSIKKSLYLMPRIPIQEARDTNIKLCLNPEVKSPGVFLGLYPIKDTFALNKDLIENLDDQELRNKIDKWFENEEFSSFQIYVLGDFMKFDNAKITKSQNNAYQKYYTFKEIWNNVIE